MSHQNEINFIRKPSAQMKLTTGTSIEEMNAVFWMRNWNIKNTDARNLSSDVLSKNFPQ